MRFERPRSGVGGDGRSAGGELVAGNEDIVVGGATAFGGDDVGVVRRRDFVDDADEAFGPLGVVVGFVLFWSRKKRAL